MSREEATRFVVDNFGCPMTAASVEAICKRASDALAGAYGELADAVAGQPVVHMDETGWRWPALRRWAWLASTDQIAVYHLTNTRAGQIAKDMLGEDFTGILVSDRYGAYNWLDPAQRQVCYSHLLRDLQALAERGGRIARLGPGAQADRRRDPRRAPRPPRRRPTGRLARARTARSSPSSDGPA